MFFFLIESHYFYYFLNWLTSDDYEDYDGIFFELSVSIMPSNCGSEAQ